MRTAGAPANPRLGDSGSFEDRLVECIEACIACASACIACAEACPGERDVTDAAGPIRTNLDCIDLCELTAWALARRTAHGWNLPRALLQACATACAEHADRSDHSSATGSAQRVACATACRLCATSCRDLLIGIR
jgi:hypothetical protein